MKDITKHKTDLSGEAATLEFAAKVARLSRPPLRIHLHGDLGSGKTTFARGFIHQLGHCGKVKSPTFTLVETYDLEQTQLYHFDLYRLNEPSELDCLGLRDLDAEPDVISLIEWPEKADTKLTAADLEFHLQYQPDSRQVEYYANSAKGQRMIDQLQN